MTTINWIVQKVVEKCAKTQIVIIWILIVIRVHENYKDRWQKNKFKFKSKIRIKETNIT